MHLFSIRRACALAAAAVAALVPALPAAAHSPSDYRAERAHVEARARHELGDPYRSGGTSQSGFDCSGFTRWVYSGHGAYLPHSSGSQYALADRHGYQRVWNRHKLETGDLVFFRTTSAQVGHVGIYIGHGKFISSTTSSGVHVDSVWDPYYWGARWVGATRLPVTTRFRDAQSSRPHVHQLI